MRMTDDTAVRQLSDAELLHTAELQLPPGEDRRLSELLNRQQADLLTEKERGELADRMRVYEAGLLRKSEALAEAVRRGLRPPLPP